MGKNRSISGCRQFLISSLKAQARFFTGMNGIGNLKEFGRATDHLRQEIQGASLQTQD
jgi:hypothetical protein